MTEKDKYQEDEDNREGFGRLSRREFALGAVAALAATSNAFGQGQSGQIPRAAQSGEYEVPRGKMPPTEVSVEAATRMFPIENEPRINTMDRPLIIQCSSPGWQIGGERYPAVPFSIEDQAQDLADAVNAGAVAIHVHPRNPNTGLAMINSALLKEVLDATFAKVGDCVTISHTWYPRDGVLDYIVDTEELVEWGHGNKYCQGSIVLPFSGAAAKASVDKGLRWLQENEVKPCFEFYDTSAQIHFKELIDEIGNLKKPLSLDVNLGKHDSTAIHQDPGSYLNAIANLDIVKKTFPGNFYGWRTGGRNWMPIMTLGIMMGVDLVQVGLEDAYWRWPHRDELIGSSAESVKWAVDIATTLGRRVVTDPDEARELMGINLTSKM